jgi:hypothetical protein
MAITDKSEGEGCVLVIAIGALSIGVGILFGTGWGLVALGATILVLAIFRV